MKLIKDIDAIAAAIREMVAQGIYPSPGHASTLLRGQINDALFYRVRRWLIASGAIDLSRIERPRNQLETRDARCRPSSEIAS